jgi:phosphate starvation-inducible PhoH-like protein
LREKIITLHNISLIDFLGVENKHLKEVAAAFPKSRIISRGNEIKIMGEVPEVALIGDLINSLLSHYQRNGSLNEDQVKDLLKRTGLSLHPRGEGEEAEIPDDVVVFGNRGLVVKARTENQKKMLALAKENDLVFAVGPAGTGKTYMAVAIAVSALKNKEVKKIVITRPAVEAGENLGFLPGDLKEKIDPYLIPIYDALDDMVSPEKLKYYYENRIIEIAPLAFMRGRTLHNAFILLDEAQNTTPMQIKMFMTRMGPHSKMIITGDRSQIDLPSKQKSGLIDALQILKGIKGIGVIELTGKDIMRHKLVENIINAYDKKDKLAEE